MASGGGYSLATRVLLAELAGTVNDQDKVMVTLGEDGVSTARHLPSDASREELLALLQPGDISAAVSALAESAAGVILSTAGALPLPSTERLAPAIFSKLKGTNSDRLRQLRDALYSVDTAADGSGANAIPHSAGAFANPQPAGAQATQAHWATGGGGAQLADHNSEVRSSPSTWDLPFKALCFLAERARPMIVSSYDPLIHRMRSG